MNEEEEKGWTFTDYDWEDLYDFNLSVSFEYRGRIYDISCEEDNYIIAEDTCEVLYRFNSKEELYNLQIFGRPIKGVIDESYMIELW